MVGDVPGFVTRDVAVIGNVNVDLIVRDVIELPPPGTESAVDSVDLRAGGAAVNTALTLAALNVPASVVGSVGDDRFGAFLIGELAAADVDTSCVRTIPGAPTGISIAFEAPGRDRSFLTLLGSLADFDASMVPRQALAARFVVFVGYFLLPALADGLRELMVRAGTGGSTILFDPGWDPAGWPPSTVSRLRDLLPAVDVLVPNAMEAAALSGEEDPLVAARMLQEATRGWAVVKLGAEGCLAVGPGGAEVSSSAPPVDVVDTVGAGDAFDGGLIAALRDGSTVPEALGFATRVASALVARASSGRHPGRSDLA
jgi:sugar/nucleoside kinase (ribokinase family)